MPASKPAARRRRDGDVDRRLTRPLHRDLRRDPRRRRLHRVDNELRRFTKASNFSRETITVGRSWASALRRQHHFIVRAGRRAERQALAHRARLRTPRRARASGRARAPTRPMTRAQTLLWQRRVTDTRLGSAAQDSISTARTSVRQLSPSRGVSLAVVWCGRTARSLDGLQGRHGKGCVHQ
jgi:hypothetical protein